MRSLRVRVDQAMRLVRQRPSITRESGALPVGSHARTFVVVCGPGFDQEVPTAGTTCRLGWCAGFEQIGIPYVLLSVKDVARRLPDIPNPICWISGIDYAYLDAPAIAALRRTQHIVWVNQWFEGQDGYCEKHGLPLNLFPDEPRERILSSSPTLLFTISPERSFDFYRFWMDRGPTFASLPLACDTARYPSSPVDRPEFSDIDIAFVGGYWPYKARQFDRYLRPHEDRLTVFGYSAWPYAGYGGPLRADREASLYKQARLAPCINEPHVEVMGTDLNERVFKVLGSGGLAVTDVTPAYRDWFTEDELFVPRSVDEFHEFVDVHSADQESSSNRRRLGRQAVLERHTYAHRAEAVLRHLGIEQPTLSGRSERRGL